MSKKALIIRSLAAIACSTALVAAATPVSALTAVAPSLPQASAPIEKVWCGWGGCGWGGGWGWGPAAVAGGLIAGTAIGAAAAASAPYYYAPQPYYYSGYYAPAYYPGYSYAPPPPRPAYGRACVRRSVYYAGRWRWRRVC
jgi:hypothetical protein